jgi:hypothetical protein
MEFSDCASTWHDKRVDESRPDMALLLTAIGHCPRSQLESLLIRLIAKPELYSSLVEAAKFVQLLPTLGASSGTQTLSVSKKKRRFDSNRATPPNKDFLTKLAVHATPVMSSTIFPFLGLAEHTRLARTSRLMLQIAGVRPPACMCIRAPTWKKEVTLKSSASDEQVRQLCSFARPITFILQNCRNITDAALACMKPLKQLQHLDLAYCELITNAGLWNLQLMRLIILDMSGCILIKDTGLACLQNLQLQSSLSELYLNGCVKVTDVGLAHLSGMPLKILELDGCVQITSAGLTCLADMPLQALSLCGCSLITDHGLSHLQNLGALTRLMLRKCDRITDVGIQNICQLPLKSLDLGGCFRISDVGLSYLDQLSLEQLSLSDCDQITDAGLAHLQLENLKNLYLNGCMITDATLFALQHVQLVDLDLNFCSLITDAGLVCLHDMPLTRLYLSGNELITAEGIEYVQNAHPSCLEFIED